MSRLHAVVIAAALTCIGFAVQPLFADDYPSRPITDIVASTPGGGTDIVSRIFGEQLIGPVRETREQQKAKGA